MRYGPRDLPALERAFGRFLIELGVRRVLPADRERRPAWDTGGAPPTVATTGAYRPAHKMQNPDVDPREPGPAESQGAGDDHGWSNCTMAAGAMVLDFHTEGAISVWAGDLRHAPSQPDQTGGTDLWDVQHAWADYGQQLDIRSGGGWEAALRDLDDGRAIVLTGTGNVPGSATFDGGHAIAVYPERHSDGRQLQADPLCTGPEWVERDALRAWAERYDPDANWARSAAHPPAPKAAEMSYNVAPLTTHRDAVLRPNTPIYSDSALQTRSSHSDECAEQAFGFAGSGDVFHVIVNAGNTAYVARDDVLRMVTVDRTFE